MISVKAIIGKYVPRFAGLSLRERVLVTFALLGVFYFLGELFLLTPLENEKKHLHAKRESIFAQVMTYQAEFSTLVSQSLVDPHQKSLEELARLKRENGVLGKQFQTKVLELTVQKTPAVVLRELLKKDSGLRIVGLKKSAVRPFKWGGEKHESSDTGLVSQAIEVELEGSYMAVLNYLKTIENSSLHLFWDDFKLEVLEHPHNRVTLKIHTLFFEKERTSA